MKAIVERAGGLFWESVPSPLPQPNEVRIQVVATAVNRADLVQRAGRYPPPPGASTILGLECAGIVESCGAEVTRYKVGDEVIALLTGGGYAELVTCAASHVLPKPKHLSWSEAASVVEVFTTAHLNLRQEGALQGGERVLVHAGGSGVGTAAIQLCRAWGNPIFVTLGSEEKAHQCRELGASATHNRHEGSFLESVKQWGGADVILCPVGGSYLAENIHALRPRGRLVLIGLLGGRAGDLPLGPVLVKRLSVRGSVLRSRSIAEKAGILHKVRADVWPLLEDGSVRAIVDRVFPIQEVEAAHTLLQTNQTFGKIVLTVAARSTAKNT